MMNLNSLIVYCVKGVDSARFFINKFLDSVFSFLALTFGVRTAVLVNSIDKWLHGIVPRLVDLNI